MQQAARVSDFTAFLLNGRLIECSPTPQLFTTPGDPRTEAYITGPLRMSDSVHPWQEPFLGVVIPSAARDLLLLKSKFSGKGRRRHGTPFRKRHQRAKRAAALDGQPRRARRSPAVHAVLDSDEPLARRVLEEEDAINELQLEIDDRVVQLLALHSSWPLISVCAGRFAHQH